jgi:hypothetical protein
MPKMIGGKTFYSKDADIDQMSLTPEQCSEPFSPRLKSSFWVRSQDTEVRLIQITVSRRNSNRMKGADVLFRQCR